MNDETSPKINPANNTIVFTIGRMNPPTSGHLKLIKKLMEKAFELNENKIYIILSHSQDDRKNPLKCYRKRELLTTSGMMNKIKMENPDLEHIEVNIRCMDDAVDKSCGKNPILKQICQIRKEELDARQLVLVIGEDRGSSYNWVSRSLGSLNPPVILETEVVARPEGAMSATFMRGLVTSGTDEDKDQFIEESINNGLSRENAVNLYKHLTNVLGPAAFDASLKKSKTIGRKRRAPVTSSISATHKKTMKLGGGKRKNKMHTRRTHKRKTHKHRAYKHKHKSIKSKTIKKRK